MAHNAKVGERSNKSSTGRDCSTGRIRPSPGVLEIPPATSWDRRYFESLNRIVQAEPWLTRDKVMIDQVKSLGIENGNPFNPDAKRQDTLKDAAREASAWLANKHENSYFPPPYYDGTRWHDRSPRPLDWKLFSFRASRPN